MGSLHAAAALPQPGPSRLLGLPTQTENVFVLAADFSDPQSFPVRFAEALASRHSAPLVLTHMVDPALCISPSAALRLPNEQEEPLDGGSPDAELAAIDKEAPAHLHSAAERETHLLAVEESIRRHHPSLLILGTGAHSEAARERLGGVARRLSLHCQCPILVVGPEDPRQLSFAGRWERILAATDFSSASTTALLYAHRVVRSEIVALHCPVREPRQGEKEWIAKLQFLAPFNESHTVPITHVVRDGRPGLVIHTLGETMRADLIVLGAPCRDLEEEELHQSTICEVVAHARCPVLLVPATLPVTRGDTGCTREKGSAPARISAPGQGQGQDQAPPGARARRCEQCSRESPAACKSQSARLSG